MTCVLYLPITLATQNPQNQAAGVTSHADCPMDMALVGAHFTPPFPEVGGAMASWLVRSTPDRVVRVRVLAEDIVLCSWARHFTLTVPLSTQVYKWVPANLMLGGNPAMD